MTTKAARIRHRIRHEAMRRTLARGRAGLHFYTLNKAPLHRRGRAQPVPGTLVSQFKPCPPITIFTRRLCRHATGEPSAYAAHALEAGFDRDRLQRSLAHAAGPILTTGECAWINWANMWKKCGGRNGPSRARRFKLALEVDWLPGQEDWIRDLAGRHPWDYFIGRSITSRRRGLWTTRNRCPAGRRPIVRGLVRYFERLTQAAATGLFENSSAMPILPKKFKHPAAGGLRPAVPPLPGCRQD